MERNLPEDLCESILSVFPKDNTLAIIIFGSYGTDKQREDSDLDIAWIPKEKPKMFALSDYTYELNKILNTGVDLKIVTERYPVELRYNIFKGDVIYSVEEFEDYLDVFYREASDLLDMMYWRDNDGI